MPDATRCHACTAIEAKRRKYDESSSQRALYFHAEPDAALMYAMEHPLPYAPPD